MKYPTMAEVEAADHEQICRWYRFLPSPGWTRMTRDDADFESTRNEVAVLDRILARYHDMGGMTPELSKKIGLVEK